MIVFYVDVERSRYHLKNLRAHEDRQSPTVPYGSLFMFQAWCFLKRSLSGLLHLLGLSLRKPKN